jgi:hypothetical protein
MRLYPIVFVACCAALASTPAPAGAEARYVFCDNGLRCIKAPCPSNNALDLATGTVMRGVSLDPARLPGGSAERVRGGKLVVRGFIQRRTVTYTGKEYELPFLVATAAERASTPAERARCFSR